MNRMANHFLTKFVGEPIHGVQAAGIALNPVQDDNRFVKFWKQETWQKVRKGVGIEDVDVPVLSIFMEDEFGNPIPKGIRRALRSDVYAFWIDLETPKIEGYLETGLATKESFRKTMEGKYPWLRLCEGHWKVGQVWTNCLMSYSRWSKSKDADPKVSKKTTPTSTEPTNCDGIPVIEIETSDSSASAGSKRGRKDDSDEQLQKKHKGKEVASSFHPARPQRMKPKAKVAKVSPFSFLLAKYLLRRI